MKHIVLAQLFLLAFLQLQAQNTAPGYYISANNDTITAQIKLKKGLFGQVQNKFTEELQVVAEDGMVTTFHPEDIKAYSVQLENERYSMFSKPTAKEGQKFLSPVYIGPKSSLYQYGYFTSGSGTVMSNSQVFYTFEKADGSFLFLKNIMNKKLKSELKTFYAENTAAQEFIDGHFRYWLELPTDLRALMMVVNQT
ncbi:hypothetical protein [Croceiramulus getboli]|nr:hypothetical protein P8624_13975 [Flavobacteriaceae bacterium YJPT1-3]